ncbi:hypothetical protein DFA_12221 [Cavenderia fasciculata]|uniref:Uncharacterized protein n=1 Tax=Cavenderia fasciculata TaxID=261658 RepID=F4QCM1_CACFS|nr:uncharacterized protein DFA_12221 [Cavenderia fasciculata]EGG14449.1 hypothetical protein DFA_12221 [Cavenderia fasciculata]|eukprot:XP_004353858.1 hypothetical protein DFA_12221 [Cavenderia fasciculata]
MQQFDNFNIFTSNFYSSLYLDSFNERPASSGAGRRGGFLPTPTGGPTIYSPVGRNTNLAI